MKKNLKKLCAMGITAAVAATTLAGCGSSAATGSSAAPDAAASESASTTAATTENGGDFTADESLKGQSITFLNSKGEIQSGLEEMAADYESETGVHVEIQACGTGEVPYTKITTAYQSKNAPTMAMLDTTDVIALAEEYAMDLSDEKWQSEVEGMTTEVNGKVYSYPFCVEGRGLIYNKDAIDSTLGGDWDPSSVNSYDSLKSLLEELVAAGMETPVVISHEDWSLGAHQLGYIYDTYDGTTAGSAKIINDLETGAQDVADYERYTQFMDTFDLLLENNFNKEDPNGSQYDQDALALADGEAAFWANGSWAWPDIESAGADADGNFGFIPFVLGNDTSDFANTSMQASPTKQVIIDNVLATPEQQAAAKQFLNWIVYSATGQNDMVTKLAIVPANKNNATEPADPLGRAIKDKIAAGQTYSSSFVAPSDHWSEVGASMQQYLAGKTDRAGLAAQINEYWSKQTPTASAAESTEEASTEATEEASTEASTEAASTEAASTEAASTEAE